MICWGFFKWVNTRGEGGCCSCSLLLDGSKERAPRVKDDSFMNSEGPARQEKIKKMNKEVGKGGARAEVESRVLVPEG